jgi:ferredoxin-NADP reductase/cytochrome P450/CRP-like cAMP-binding protein
MDLSRLLAVAKSDLLQGLRSEQVDRLLEKSSSETFAPGEVILTEGDEPDGAYIIISGEVQIYTLDSESDEVIVLAKLGESDFFGEQALLAPEGRRSASARAFSHCHLLKISREAVEEILLAQEGTRRQLASVGAEHAQNRFLHLSRVLKLLLGRDEAGNGPIERRFSEDEAVFYEGDAPDGLHVIVSGQARVVREVDGQLIQLNVMHPGQVFGDYALAEGTTRTATVVAGSELHTLFVGRERFLDLYRTDPGVAAYVQTLTRMYELPKRGFVSQHIGLLDGKECFYTVYDLIDRRQISVMRTGDGARCRISVETPAGRPADGGKRLFYRSPGREIELACSEGDRLAKVDVTGPWSELRDVVQRALDDVPLTPEQLKRFEDAGTLAAEHLGEETAVEASEADQEICCNCMLVSFGDVRGAIAGGARRLNLLASQLGCTTVCGGCAPTIMSLLGEGGWFDASVVSEDHHTESIRGFRLCPDAALSKEFVPGQHIIVRAKIGGRWLQRPYTLTSLPGDEAFEITVKREPRGVFSRWLFEGAHEDAEIQISPPHGGYRWQPDGRPVVCVVAGIGLTPAIAMLRQLRADELDTTLHVDCSVHAIDDLAFREELLESAEAANVTLCVRETGSDGRITRTDLEALAQRYPDAHYLVCGPDGFNVTVRDGLESLEVRRDQIHVEEFVHQGDAPAVGVTAAQPREIRPESELLRHSPLGACPARRRWHVAEAVKLASSKLIDLGNSRLLDWRVGNLQLNPARAVSDRVVEGRSKIDPAVPRERLGFLSFVLKRGPRQNLDAFERFGSDTFAYVIPRTQLKQFEGEDAVDTGFTEFSANKLIPVYVTRDRSLIEAVLGDLEHFDRGALPNHYFAQLLGASSIEPTAETSPAGLIAGRINRNTTWEKDRRLVHDHVMDELESHVEELHDELADVAEEMRAKLRECPGATWDGVSLLTSIVFRLLLRTLFGFPSREAADVRAELVGRVENGMASVVRASNSLPIDDSEFMANIAHIRSLLSALCERLPAGSATEESTGGQHRSALTRYLLENRDSGEEGMREVAKVLVPAVVGGTSTSVITLIWGLYWLLSREDLREEYLSEIQRFRRSEAETPLAPGSYVKRPFTLMLYHEILRYHTPIDVVARSASSDCTLQPSRGPAIRIPKDSLIVCSLYGCHRDEKVFADPSSFMPSRFGEGTTSDMSPEARGRKVMENVRRLESSLGLLPFGAGRGRCPGRSLNMLEFFLTLDRLMTSFEMTLVEEASDLTPYSPTGIGDYPEVLGLRIEARTGDT